MAAFNQPTESRNIFISAVIVILILGGISLLAIGLLQSTNTFNLGGVSDAAPTENNTTDKADLTSSTDISDSGEDTDSSNSNQASELVSKTSAQEFSEQNQIETNLSEKYPTTNTTYLRGNDYQFGDITSDSYEVQAGDTLWQIAEAKYGSGYAWVEIDRANGNFPLLNSGEPVKLIVGDVIVLP